MVFKLLPYRVTETCGGYIRFQPVSNGMPLHILRLLVIRSSLTRPIRVGDLVELSYEHGYYYLKFVESTVNWEKDGF